MEKTLSVINKMKEQGIITDYAIAGGMAAIFYMEPVLTYDLDIFCILPEENKLDIMAAIYKWASNDGYKTFREHIVIEGMPVQFIPVYNDLTRESVENALEKKVGSVKTRVVSPEYLVAVMLQTSRKKDIINAQKILIEAKINKQLLGKIVQKYRLQKKFNIIKDYER